MDTTNQMEKQTCCMCRNFCTDPVSLPCQDIYCRLCLEQVLDIQDKRQLYYCPHCFTGCQFRPLIKQAMTPRPCSEQVNCTYCGIPAKKTCLQCDSSFCAKDLMKHPNLPGHTLVEPTQSTEDIKCTTHKEILKYYCKEDGSYICTSCWAVGDHREHRVVLLNEFAEQKKSNLRPLIEKFQKDIEGAEKQMRSLHDYESQEKKKVDDITVEVTDQIKDIKADLRTQHNKVLNDISKQKYLVSLSVSNQVKKLKTQKKELSRRVKRITELCSMEDPLTFLKNEKESNISGSYSDLYKPKLNITIDKTFISQQLHKRLLRFADDLTDRMLTYDFPKMKKSIITLDQETAHYCISVANNLRIAYYSSKRHRRSSSKERFKSRLVISRCSFSSGNHYWEVKVGGMERCIIGVACQSMNRKTIATNSPIGFNERSWSLCVSNVLIAYHNRAKREIPSESTVRSFGIFMEFEAGRLSFYQLCEPIRHLHTFNAIFTEPLYPAFYLNKDSSIAIRK